MLLIAQGQPRAPGLLPPCPRRQHERYQQLGANLDRAASTIAEIDLNPIRVYEHGVGVLHSRIILAVKQAAAAAQLGRATRVDASRCRPRRRVPSARTKGPPCATYSTKSVQLCRGWPSHHPVLPSCPAGSASKMTHYGKVSVRLGFSSGGGSPGQRAVARAGAADFRTNIAAGCRTGFFCRRAVTSRVGDQAPYPEGRFLPACIQV